MTLTYQTESNSLLIENEKHPMPTKALNVTTKAPHGSGGSFCTLGILIFSGLAISSQIGLIKQNKNEGVTQTSERTAAVIKGL
mgnify:CR=1 FL=1